MTFLRILPKANIMEWAEEKKRIMWADLAQEPTQCSTGRASEDVPKHLGER